MRTVVVALLAFYAGQVVPLAISPWVFVALLVLLIAIGWAGMIAAADRYSVRYVEIPVARTKRPS